MGLAASATRSAKVARSSSGAVTSAGTGPAEPYVYVAMESGKEEPEFMTLIASRLDAAFATGKYDDAFETKGKE